MPVALISKSSNGRSFARSCDGWAERALQLSWRAVRDAQQLLASAVPHTPYGYATALQVLMNQREFAAAQTVWSDWIALPDFAVPMNTALQYIDFMVVNKQPASAVQAWSALSERTPELKKRSQSDNLIFNGGFEDEILNCGFDWRRRPLSRRSAWIPLSITAETARFRSTF